MKKSIFIFGIITAIVLLLAACSPQAQPTATQAAAEFQPVETLIVEGQLMPADWLDQYFTVSGRVAEVMVQDGELVSAGQVLARLEDSPDVRAAKSRAEQELMAAQQGLQALQRSAEVSLAQARLDVLAAEKTLETARDNSDEDPSEENQAMLAMAEASLALARETADRLEVSGGTDPDLLLAAQARVDSAQAALDAAQAALDSRVLRASTAGTVVDLTLQVGEWVNAGAPVITIADLDSWVVKTSNLNEADVVDISLGQIVDVVLDALPGSSLSGKVIHINARHEEKRGEITYTATIALTQAAPLQRWGMTAAVQFQP